MQPDTGSVLTMRQPSGVQFTDGLWIQLRKKSSPGPMGPAPVPSQVAGVSIHTWLECISCVRPGVLVKKFSALQLTQTVLECCNNCTGSGFNIEPASMQVETGDVPLNSILQLSLRCDGSTSIRLQAPRDMHGTSLSLPLDPQSHRLMRAS
jgi:hypothetical protein